MQCRYCSVLVFSHFMSVWIWIFVPHTYTLSLSVYIRLCAMRGGFWCVYSMCVCVWHELRHMQRQEQQQNTWTGASNVVCLLVALRPLCRTQLFSLFLSHPLSPSLSLSQHLHTEQRVVKCTICIYTSYHGGLLDVCTHSKYKYAIHTNQMPTRRPADPSTECRKSKVKKRRNKKKRMKANNNSKPDHTYWGSLHECVLRLACRRCWYMCERNDRGEQKHRVSRYYAGHLILCISTIFHTHIKPYHIIRARREKITCFKWVSYLWTISSSTFYDMIVVGSGQARARAQLFRCFAAGMGECGRWADQSSHELWVRGKFAFCGCSGDKHFPPH